MIQTLLLFKGKLPSYHANLILVSVTTRSPSASLQIKGLATEYTTAKWPTAPMSFQTTTCVMVEKGSTVFILLAFQISTFHMQVKYVIKTRYMLYNLLKIFNISFKTTKVW